MITHAKKSIQDTDLIDYILRDDIDKRLNLQYHSDLIEVLPKLAQKTVQHSVLIRTISLECINSAMEFVSTLGLMFSTEAIQCPSTAIPSILMIEISDFTKFLKRLLRANAAEAEGLMAFLAARHLDADCLSIIFYCKKNNNA